MMYVCMYVIYVHTITVRMYVCMYALGLDNISILPDQIPAVQLLHVFSLCNTKYLLHLVIIITLVI